MQDSRLPVHDERVPRVIPALKAGHEVSLRAEPINDFTFSFVAPLGAYCNDGGHI